VVIEWMIIFFISRPLFSENVKKIFFALRAPYPFPRASFSLCVLGGGAAAGLVDVVALPSAFALILHALSPPLSSHLSLYPSPMFPISSLSNLFLT